MTADRNFDDIAEHFAHKVYGGLKGKIRLAVLNRDIHAYLSTLKPSTLNVLDIGAGLAQISLTLAKQGHLCTINDISSVMLNKAYAHAQTLGVNKNITPLICPYQALPKQLTQSYDLILCHALLEWLEQPQALIDTITPLLKQGGALSLCFYNPAAPIYRNLIMGNFNHLNNPKPADKGSLTPNHPVAYDTVKSWLGNYHIISQSGIRTFYDYTVHQRGGLSNPQAVIDMELKYARQMPFLLMGRYLHILASKI